MKVRIEIECEVEQLADLAKLLSGEVQVKTVRPAPEPEPLRVTTHLEHPNAPKWSQFAWNEVLPNGSSATDYILAKLQEGDNDVSLMADKMTGYAKDKFPFLDTKQLHTRASKLCYMIKSRYKHRQRLPTSSLDETNTATLVEQSGGVESE